MQHVEILDEYQIEAAEDDSAVVSAEEKNQATETDTDDLQDASDERLDLQNIDFLEQLESDPDSLLKELATIGQSAFVLQILSAAATHGNPALVKQNLRDFIAHSQTRIEQLHTSHNTLAAKETAAIRQLQTRVVSQPTLTSPQTFPKQETVSSDLPQQTVVTEMPVENITAETTTEIETLVLPEQIITAAAPVIKLAGKAAVAEMPVVSNEPIIVPSVSTVEAKTETAALPTTPVVLNTSAVTTKPYQSTETSVSEVVPMDVVIDTVMPITVEIETSDVSIQTVKQETSVQTVPKDTPILTVETVAAPEKTVLTQETELPLEIMQGNTVEQITETVFVKEPIAVAEVVISSDVKTVQENFADTKTVESPVVFEPEIMVRLTERLQVSTQDITTQDISPSVTQELDIAVPNDVITDTPAEFLVIESLLNKQVEIPEIRSENIVQNVINEISTEKTTPVSEAVIKTLPRTETVLKEKANETTFELVADVFLPEADDIVADQPEAKIIPLLLPLREAKPLPTMVAANFKEIISKETPAPDVLRPETLPMRRAYSTENDKPILSHFNQNIVEKITPQVKVLDTAEEPDYHAEETLEQEATQQPVMAASYMDPVAAYAALYGYAPAEPAPTPKAEPSVVQMPGYNNQYRYAS